MQTHANATMAGGSSSEPLNLRRPLTGRLIRLSAVMPDGGHLTKWATWPSTCAAIDHALNLGARSASASVVTHLQEAA